MYGSARLVNINPAMYLTYSVMISMNLQNKLSTSKNVCSHKNCGPICTNEMLQREIKSLMLQVYLKKIFSCYSLLRLVIQFSTLNLRFSCI